MPAWRENSFKTKCVKVAKRNKLTENYSSTESPFYATRSMFKNHLNYTHPWTYEEWLELSDSNKAAALYVRFFDQITLAWYKTKSFYTLDEDGVSTVLQYLMKNVEVIKEKSSRYSEGYIYKVAYNCLYCICHDIKRDRERFEKETSNVLPVGGGTDEVDLFDTVPDIEDILATLDRQAFWSLIDREGEDTAKVVEKLLRGLHPRGAKNAAIIERLRVILEPYKSEFYA